MGRVAVSLELFVTLLVVANEQKLEKFWAKTISSNNSNWRIQQQIKKLLTEGPTEGEVEGPALGTTEGPVLGLVLGQVDGAQK